MLTSVLHDIVLAARRTDTDVSHFIAVLDERRRQLAEPQEQSVLEAIVAGLIGDTQQMQRVAAEFTERFESNAKEVATLQARLKEAESDAFADPLTGLSNRRGFDRHTQSCGETPGSLAGSALLFVDIDHFKAVNDKFGHVLGDKVLRAVASVIRASIKGRDIAARFGGEEFVVLLPDTTLEGARALAEQIRAALGKGRVRDAQGTSIGQVTVSIGIARAKSADTIESLLERADAALYAAKRAGRNQIVCATSAV
jgi:diguanylate cyclase